VITEERWKEAQAREAVAWERMGAAQGGYLERRAARLESWLSLWDIPLRRVLEIGGAGMPAVDFFRGARTRHAVDPLMGHYARLFGRTKGIAARAEELPYPDGAFDGVLFLNVLDHVQDPGRCLAEAARVLDPKGLLLLSCDVYARPWLLLRAARVRLLGVRNNDVLHPHHFTADTLLGLFRQRFEVLDASLALADPLARDRRPFRGTDLLGRIKGEARLYIVGRPC